MRDFQWPLRVYIEDTDAGGIVYYVNYLKFMERARTELFRSHGFGRDFVFNRDLMFVVHSLNSQYLQPATLDDELLVTANVIKSGKSYVLLEQCVYRSKSSGDREQQLQSRGELLCRGEVKIACVNRQTIKPMRMPQELLSALAD